MPQPEQDDSREVSRTEQAGADACVEAALDAGHTPGEAEHCNDEEHGCPQCPWGATPIRCDETLRGAADRFSSAARKYSQEVGPLPDPPIQNREHALKTTNPWFSQIWEGTKKFEVRTNDRRFQVGDVLVLQEYDNERSSPYTGRMVRGRVTAMLSHSDSIRFGIHLGDTVVMGFVEIGRREPEREPVPSRRKLTDYL